MVQFGPIGKHPHVFKTDRIVGPQIVKWQFFHKTDPLLIWILCGKVFKNFKIGPIGANWQIPHLAENSPQYGAPNTGVGNFDCCKNRLYHPSIHPSINPPIHTPTKDHTFLQKKKRLPIYCKNLIQFCAKRKTGEDRCHFF